MYTVLSVGKKDYKLRLTASSIVQLEKSLGGKNPLNVLMAVQDGEVPSLTGLLYILHASMQKFHHATKFQDVLDLYDEYVSEGNSYTDLIPVLLDVFKVSGFFPKETQEGDLETLPKKGPSKKPTETLEPIQS